MFVQGEMYILKYMNQDIDKANLHVVAFFIKVCITKFALINIPSCVFVVVSVICITEYTLIGQDVMVYLSGHNVTSMCKWQCIAVRGKFCQLLMLHFSLQCS